MSSRLFLRRVLGRKLTFFLRNSISDSAFRSKMIPKATSINRKNGISAMMCTMNEEDWIEPSMLSIKDLVVEYIAIDSSSDQTPKIITDIANKKANNRLV